jgi:hypothetical protein
VRAVGSAWEAEDGSGGERVSHAAAVLALAPGGTTQQALFETVYGFPFTLAKQEGALRVLLHRARAALEGGATIERDGDRLTLVPERTLLLPDPRCARPLAERVLALVAASPHGTPARDVASALRVPLRTVQLALHGLVEEGACEAVRDDRSVAYVVEDTTFAAPSFTRLGRAPGG